MGPEKYNPIENPSVLKKMKFFDAFPGKTDFPAHRLYRRTLLDIYFNALLLLVSLHINAFLVYLPVKIVFTGLTMLLYDTLFISISHYISALLFFHLILVGALY